VKQPFELALSRSNCDEAARNALETHGWRVCDALTFSGDLDRYRDYISGSRAEFTVAKDQNVRLRSGWFSDRSATYLAAGRPGDYPGNRIQRCSSDRRRLIRIFKDGRHRRSRRPSSTPTMRVSGAPRRKSRANTSVMTWS
jgi:hypothetical protein